MKSPTAEERRMAERIGVLARDMAIDERNVRRAFDLGLDERAIRQTAEASARFGREFDDYVAAVAQILASNRMPTTWRGLAWLRTKWWVRAIRWKILEWRGLA